jgi:hypothetical protein
MLVPDLTRRPDRDSLARRSASTRGHDAMGVLPSHLTAGFGFVG